MSTDINDLRWTIGWSPLLVVGGAIVVFGILGVMLDEPLPLVGVGAVAGTGIWGLGVQEINNHYRSVLTGFVDNVERTAKRAIEARDAELYSLSYGSGNSPPLVTPKAKYLTTAIVVTDSSITINQGAAFDMQSREGAGGGRNKEIYYDQITGVESVQNGRTKLQISTSGGNTISIDSNQTETVDAVVSDLRTRVRKAKTGRNAPSRGPPSADASVEASPQAQQRTQGDEAPSSTDQASQQAERGPAQAEPADTTTDTVVHEVAKQVSTQMDPETTVATELCDALGDPSADQTEVRAALEAAVERVEETTRTAESLDMLTGGGSTAQVETVQRQLAQQSGPVSSAVTPVVDRVERAEAELEQATTESDRLGSSARRLCQHAEKKGLVTFPSASATDRRLETLADAIDDDVVTLEATTQRIAPVATRVRRESDPESGVGSELLAGLQDPEAHDLDRILQTTVESLDRYARLESSLADIGPADVRRRIESLDDELHSTEGPIYRHLADRIREFETVLDTADASDPVQLYAIYHECTYYDRTLLPRISRANVEGESMDIDTYVDSVDDRIEGIEREYISVRADHNHSIPKHFVSLASALRDRATECKTREPERSKGLLVATDELLQHVEQLYERNEFSVMLRRLRG